MSAKIIIPTPVKASHLVKLLQCFEGDLDNLYVDYKKSHLNVTSCLAVKSEEQEEEQQEDTQDNTTEEKGEEIEA